jgi:hypothetical protein
MLGVPFDDVARINRNLFRDTFERDSLSFLGSSVMSKELADELSKECPHERSKGWVG